MTPHHRYRVVNSTFEPTLSMNQKRVDGVPYSIHKDMDIEWPFQNLNLLLFL